MSIIGALLCLYCRSGCQASVVASALAFHPPNPPYYEFDYNSETSEYTFALANDVPTFEYENVKSVILETPQKTKVPLVILRHPKAKFTILFRSDFLLLFILKNKLKFRI